MIIMFLIESTCTILRIRHRHGVNYNIIRAAFRGGGGIRSSLWELLLPLDFHECDVKVNTTCYIVLHVIFFEAKSLMITEFDLFHVTCISV